MAALFVALFSGLALAQSPNMWPPEALAKAVEKKADSTSFAKLEDFGRTTMRLKGRDRLDRLYHVAWVFLNQSEFAKFEDWNGRLASLAKAEQDVRYIEVARINELRRRYDDGDPTATPEIERAAATETDWFARIHAMRVQAYVMTTKDEIGAALRLLTDHGEEALVCPPDTVEWSLERSFAGAKFCRFEVVRVYESGLPPMTAMPAGVCAFSTRVALTPSLTRLGLVR